MSEGLIYLDSSAIVKLVVAEPESAALAAELAGRRPLVTSAIARVEVPRRVRPHGDENAERARQFLASVESIPITESLLHGAAELMPASLRTLDAIHIASALILGDELEVLITYDRRMAEAAESIGIPVASPA